MREDDLRREVASQVAGATTTLPTSMLGRPARLILGLARAGTRSLGRAVRRRVGRRREPDVGPEAAVVASLGQLKGVAMKMGQLLGYVDVGLPSDLRTALSVLHTGAQPLAQGRIAGVVDTELGDAGRALARAMSPSPLRVAPLGQVHRSVLPDGTAVAVKVAYPGIAKAVTRDFAPAALTGRVASIVDRRRRLRHFVSAMRARVLEECDYTVEARRQERFAAIFAGHPSIVIPTVQRDFSSARVLTTTLAEGVHLDEFLASAPSAEARQRAGEALFDFYVGALFREGLYHSDPQPGNYVFLPDGRVAIVDFGSVRELASGCAARLAMLTDALGVDDRERIYRALVDLGLAGEDRPYHHEPTCALLLALYGPLLRDEVAAFEPAGGIALRELVRRWRRAGGLALAEELVLLLPASVGLSSVLRRLEVRANWHRRLHRMLAAAATSLPQSPDAQPAADVVASAPQGVAPPRSSAATTAAATTATTVDTGAFDVVLVHPGNSPIALVRKLRELTGLELRDVKYLMDAAPQIIKASVPGAEARALRERLESAGARIELNPAAQRPPAAS